MAIVIEQEQSGKGGLIKIITWGVIFAVILVGAYFLFFKNPEAIPSLAQPAALKEVNVLSQVKLDPDAVIQSPAFQALKPQTGDMPQPPTGRSNPFQP